MYNAKNIILITVLIIAVLAILLLLTRKKETNSESSSNDISNGGNEIIQTAEAKDDDKVTMTREELKELLEPLDRPFVFYCPNCGKEHKVFPDENGKIPSELYCEKCKTKILPPGNSEYYPP